LTTLHKSCQDEKGQDDQKKGSQLVDIYALEIQMYTATKNQKNKKNYIIKRYLFKVQFHIHVLWELLGNVVEKCT